MNKDLEHTPQEKGIPQTAENYEQEMYRRYKIWYGTAEGRRMAKQARAQWERSQNPQKEEKE